MEVDNIQPGEYYLYAQIDFATEQREYCLTSYGEGNVQFLGNEAKTMDNYHGVEHLDFMDEIFKSRALSGRSGVKRSNMAQYKAPGVIKYVDLNAAELGWAVFFY